MSTAACASITQGSTQNVTVITDPPGAQCNLQRGSQSIAAISRTPQSVTLDKSRQDIAVVCKHEGYEDGASTLVSEFAGMTIGNVLFGGLIGVAVDSASGAMNKYPSEIRLALFPSSFPSEAARDDFFARRRVELDREAAEVEKRIAESCAASADLCRQQREAAQAVQQTKLAELEAKRLAIPVR
ncbi:hypothetical protein [Pseudoroseomonas cervicalis]|uniref:hypothetical protein n=1 Tax=Teichococcus cervicalis TaxID=204525 RepID=UPI0022F1CAF6|nr:hypothetical protein [Pseudoroseomonas cervicalis]WBV43983.1 hypothetical protein PFY06_05280 [Pseudoroseomonas cervicalis]